MKPNLIFDFDSTLICLEALDELAKIALEGKPDRDERLGQIEAITNAGMIGEIDFAQSLEQRLALFAANKSNILKLVEHLSNNLSPSVTGNRKFFQDNAEHIYVISGGFEEYIKPVVKALGVKSDHIYANRFEYDEAGNITGYDQNLAAARDGGKVIQVRELKLERPIIVIGDGYSDAQIREHGEADKFYAFTENVRRETVCAIADAEVADMDELISRLSCTSRT